MTRRVLILAIWYRVVLHVLGSLTAANGPSRCSVGVLEGRGFTAAGDIIIGGIFPVHYNKVFPDTPFTDLPKPIVCEKFSLRSYRWLQAMVFAIKEINENPLLLPNITLGFAIYDSCDVIPRGLEGALWQLSGQDDVLPGYRCRPEPLAAIIGDAGSGVTLPVARMLGLYGYPQISYFSSVPLLSDRRQFPSFFRTIPSDEFQSRALARLVRYFGWSWVGILAAEDDYGQLGSQILREEIQGSGVCLAFSETVPVLYNLKKIAKIVQVVKSSTANVIIVFSFESYLIPVMAEMARQNVTGKVWIASEAWSTSPSLAQKDQLRTLGGTIGFAIRRGEIPGLKEHLLSVSPQWPLGKSANLNKNSDVIAWGENSTTQQQKASSGDVLVKLFWEEVFKCKWPDLPDHMSSFIGSQLTCTQQESLASLDTAYSDVSNLRVTYNVYNAVYAVANALHDLHFCKHMKGPFLNNECANIQDFEPWQIPRSVCTESCPAGTRKATRRGQPVCCFDCIPCSEGAFANESDSAECLYCPEGFWSSEKRDSCTPKLIEFLSFQEPLGVVLVSLSVVTSLMPISTLAIFLWHHHTPIVKANNRQLSYVLLCALAMCPLCSLIFIGRPSPTSCMLRQTAFGTVFALSVSCVLAKTIMVVIAFRASKPGSGLQKWVGSCLPNSIACGGTLFQLPRGGGVWKHVLIAVAAPTTRRTTWIIVGGNMTYENMMSAAVTVKNGPDGSIIWNGFYKTTEEPSA
ncbi:extracellular calcium-sensing receptor-like [Polypterus senegalus]|uniref:extracellular calcium-sensing receptor-like n=1 Tax=Polypterus senegalus TaxID=55291 RepID=UPI00196345A7|nr:extracellular calcium-sensing receptor-like [Polypterus senegalus]